MRRAASASSVTGGHERSQGARAERKELCKQVCSGRGAGARGGVGEEKATGTNLGEEPRHFPSRSLLGDPTSCALGIGLEGLKLDWGI